MREKDNGSYVSVELGLFVDAWRWPAEKSRVDDGEKAALRIQLSVMFACGFDASIYTTSVLTFEGGECILTVTSNRMQWQRTTSVKQLQ